MQRREREEIGEGRLGDDERGEPAHPRFELETGEADHDETGHEHERGREQGSTHDAECAARRVWVRPSDLASGPLLLAEEVHLVVDHDSKRHSGHLHPRDQDRIAHHALIAAAEDRPGTVAARHVEAVVIPKPEFNDS